MQGRRPVSGCEGAGRCGTVVATEVRTSMEEGRMGRVVFQVVVGASQTTARGLNVLVANL